MFKYESIIIAIYFPWLYNVTYNTNEKGVVNMGLLEFILIILIICWILGISLSIGGGLIHLLLIVAVIVFIYDMIVRRRL